MKLSKLGYTKKWIRYEFLTPEDFEMQLKHFLASEEKVQENYRFTSFVNWLDSKDSITDRELENFVELAVEDQNEHMAGSALKELIESPKISDKQFAHLKIQFTTFGDWTKKVILRETLIRRLNNEPLSVELFEECLNYKTEFKDSRLLISIIQNTEDLDILSRFADSPVGKRIKTLADKKINKIIRQNQA